MRRARGSKAQSTQADRATPRHPATEWSVRQATEAEEEASVVRPRRKAAKEGEAMRSFLLERAMSRGRGGGRGGRGGGRGGRGAGGGSPAARRPVILLEVGRKRPVSRGAAAAARKRARLADGGGGDSPRGGAAGDDSASSTGSAEGAGKQAGPAHRRDWGLREIDSVGPNKPPFARTTLCKGQLPETIRDLDAQWLGKRHWVIKRWPEKASRRTIDTEGHEKIKAHPHPQLVGIVDVSASDGVLMEYWSEGDLQKQLATARRKYMPVDHILCCVAHVLTGLQHLHRIKVVHCDVSPPNIFVRRDKSALSPRGKGGDDKLPPFVYALGDFGHSYILDQHEESRSSVAASGVQGFTFVAPEVAEGSVSSMASDVYSVGKIMEHMINLSATFKESFDKESRSQVRQLRALVGQMCNVNPEQRPSSDKAARTLALI